MDFQYTRFSYGWVIYQFRFLWKGEAIIKDSVLRRDSEGSKNRSKNAFRADDDEDSFLPILKEVLESNEAGEWAPIEPDVCVGIYPDEFFPFLSHDWFVLRKALLNDDQKAEREVKEKLKKEKPGNLPDDFFTFIICASENNFKGGSLGAPEGISLHMIVRRHELERFAEDLEREYQEFKVKYAVDEYDEYRDDKREDGPFFKGADLAFAYLRNADLRKIRESTKRKNLAFADLRNTDLRNAKLYEADLRGADLAFADLSGSDLREADLRNAKLGNAKLYDAWLYRTNLSRAKLRNADLRRAAVCGADLRGADLTFADLSGSDLRDTDLRDANLYGADLRGADLTDGLGSPTLHLLKGANLVLAKLEGIYFNGRLESTASINLRLV